MNLTKTEVLAQHAGNTPPQIYVNNQELPITEKFTYLGSVVTSSCSLDEEILRRIELASSAFGRLTHRVFINHSLNLNTKEVVCQAICVSIMLFSCKSWQLYRYHSRKLESFHGACIRKVLGIKWFQRVPRSESREDMDLPSLEERILRRQLRWAGHVLRMPPSRFPRQVL